MAERMSEVMNPSAVQRDPRFPHAPAEWTPQTAEAIAREQGVELNEERWELVRAVQEYYHRHEESGKISLRELHDALDERFHSRGGRKYLYELMPGGPVAQGARLAGVEPPPEAVNTSFGSVS
ncbi:TusE/DsrC/DsvC family sulfur relay protein [Thioalkalivibrio paradoxus]|uniref:Sulfite reductase n=1 Tax=Thioalkalivibrio paradoxus ARh 1 TaxID=713585 RepID=W0DIB6_9GAMM|nr:TusE/DsrC/DsvC family sulfur relay protein [Thioalkalivibrio paradoxus]AHE98146.1 sulfite reductase [Thioalkalivibrio paradoxus ARh 1]